MEIYTEIFYLFIGLFAGFWIGVLTATAQKPHEEQPDDWMCIRREKWRRMLVQAHRWRMEAEKERTPNTTQNEN